MTFSQKYCIVQFLEPTEIGYEFPASEWPLHCTIVGVFSLDWTAQRLQEFQKLISKHSAFTSSTAGEAYFGPTNNVHVQLIEPVRDLTLLHREVIDFIENNGGSCSEPLYVRDGYRPHITLHEGVAKDGTTITFHGLALVDMFPNDDPYQRRIIKHFSLNRS